MSRMRRGTPEETGRLAAVLAAAFHDDPVWRWLLPDDRTRRRRLFRFFAIELRSAAFPHGDVHTTHDHAGAVLAIRPDEWRMPAGAMLRWGPAYTRAFGPRLPHAFAMLTLLERHHPPEPHVYIAYAGVAPDRQGQGLGTALLRPALDQADAAGLPAYLEASSPDNARLYERLGFEGTQEIRLGSSPPLRLMWREPVNAGGSTTGSASARPTAGTPAATSR
jgi:ribosomal protein S18 acetylase RimI-like enzyme